MTVMVVLPLDGAGTRHCGHCCHMFHEYQEHDMGYREVIEDRCGHSDFATGDECDYDEDTGEPLRNAECLAASHLYDEQKKELERLQKIETAAREFFGSVQTVTPYLPTYLQIGLDPKHLRDLSTALGKE
jgi:hypothetical protein